MDPGVLRPGVDYLPPSGKVVGADEFGNLLQASADLWLTAGRYSDEFELKFPELWGMKKCLLVNSGSSANLLALATLFSPQLGQRALRPGDEFITAACGFPTTVAPAVQLGLKPVFVDVDLLTHSPTLSSLKQALSPKPKVVMLAHPLGNPFRADEVAAFCEDNDLWFIEDCCDALGATIGSGHVGTFGDLATCSFYPAHQMTMGEGGAVLTNDSRLFKVARSLRDWGRDCWCPPGITNTCKKRFDWQLGQMPTGYDHKYIYSHFGYNLKATDFQAAVGLKQMTRLPSFLKARRENHAYLTQKLKQASLEKFFLLPEATPGTDPSWFGYLLVVREPGRRLPLLKYLEANRVGTRLLFGGNLVKQPAIKGIDFRCTDGLENTDRLMNDAFWVGVWPGLGKEHMDYICTQLAAAVQVQP